MMFIQYMIGPKIVEWTMRVRYVKRQEYPKLYQMTESLFKIGVFTNKKLILATGVSFLLQMAAVYVPFLQKVFKTEPLGTFDWLLVILISSFPLWAMEVVKIINKKVKCIE